MLLGAEIAMSVVGHRTRELAGSRGRAATKRSRLKWIA